MGTQVRARVSPPRHHIKVSALCSALCAGGFIKAAWLVRVLAKIPRGSSHAQRCIRRAGNDPLSLLSVKEVVPTHQGSPRPPAIPVSRDFCREMAGPPGTHRQPSRDTKLQTCARAEVSQECAKVRNCDGSRSLKRCI